MGTNHFRIYELFKAQKVVELIYIYSIVVGIIFVVWLLFVVRMYSKMDK